MTWAVRAGAAFVVVVGLAVAGCGSGSVAPDWAGRVCSAVVPWRERITELNDRARAQIASATTPAQTSQQVMELLVGAEEASEAARLAVEAAGVPDVEGGPEVALRFEATLRGIRDAYAHARTQVAALSTNDASAFYQGIADILGRLTAEYNSAGVDPTTLDSLELREAFDKVDACR